MLILGMEHRYRGLGVCHWFVSFGVLCVYAIAGVHRFSIDVHGVLCECVCGCSAVIDATTIR